VDEEPGGLVDDVVQRQGLCHPPEPIREHLKGNEHTPQDHCHPFVDEIKSCCILHPEGKKSNGRSQGKIKGKPQDGNDEEGRYHSRPQRDGAHCDQGHGGADNQVHQEPD